MIDQVGIADGLLAMAVETTTDGIWSWNPSTGEASFSPRYFEVLGYETDELPASYETWLDLLHPDDHEPTRRLIEECINSEAGNYEVEFRMRTKSDRWLWILGRGNVAQRDAEGRPVLVVGSHVNIDSRKRAEEQLVKYRDELEERVRERTEELEQTSSLLEATFNAIPDVLGVQDSEHRIIRYNEAGYRFLDATLDDVKGRFCYELIGRWSECGICATSECYETKKPAAVTRYEEALDTWLDVRAYPILDDDGNLVRVIEHLRDITAEKKAEAENRELHEQLQHAQKMESLGTLAGGVAHDFNNLLMGIQGRASLLALDPTKAGDSKEHVDAIEGYVRSAAELTKQLLGFARRGRFEVRPIDVNDLVASNAKMFARTHKGLRIRTEISSDPLVVSADPGEIERVLLNMYINAWQAMPDGGELSLKTRLVDVSESEGRMQRIESGPYCRITIADTGVGMGEETLKRVFDPFFTTKEQGRGTGLGLASAYGIVSNHGGTIAVKSREGEGSTFSVFLPLTSDDAVLAVERADGIVGGTEAILLVDDETMILEVAQAMLEHLGYRVTIASGGQAALDALDLEGAAFDLVILDLVMPGMNGGRVYGRIEAEHSELQVLLSSGYPLGDEAEDLLRRGCRGFIQKPFNLVELSKHVREILDSGA